jgi:four helix bundle protein
MGRGVQRFTDLRAWQACYTYKNAVYRLCLETALAKDWDRRDDLERSVKGPPAYIAEGYGRFNPPDFARFCVMARSSLMESQNHLMDAVDKRYINETTRSDLNALAEAALQEVTGLMEYLQSPEALRNARRARERRIASRQERRSRLPSPEPGTESPEPGTESPELGTENPEPGTENPEPGTENPEPRTEPRTEPEHEPRTEKPEV